MALEGTDMNKTKELSLYEKTCRRRIESLINEYCGGNQKAFAERTGLNRGSVSQYVNGKETPSPENAKKIASAFNIDFEWIMGFDIIPDGVSDEDSEQAFELYSKYQKASPEVRAAIELLLKSPQQPS